MRRGTGPILTREWYSAGELAAMGLPQLPSTKRGLNELAAREGWSAAEREGQWWRPRVGRGGGVEYHVSVLPMLARARLTWAAHVVGEVVQPQGQPDEALWDWYSRLPDHRKKEASDRLTAVTAVKRLVADGERKLIALAMIAASAGVCTNSLRGWLKLVHGRPACDWLAALAPRHAGGREPADCSPEAWTWIKSDFLRPEPVTFRDCYRRLKKLAETNGWTIPAERTLHRRMMSIPEHQRVLAKHGPDALRRMFPAQQRDRSVFHALEAVNADGHTWDVFVKWPDGSVSRPHMVAFQDLYSGKLLSWRVEKTLSWNSVRLAFGDVVEHYGIPRACYLDNGREFAAKRITGGQPNRYRFKLRDEEPEGLMTSLGVEVHWTTPYHGQAKPIERYFRDFATGLALHPRFAGAYTGNSPTTKPSNYGSAAVPLAEFLAVVSEGIAELNARPGRRTAVCAGRSFDEAFDASYATAMIRRASGEQRRLWLLAAEGVRARSQDGAVHFHGNRYWSEFLLAHRGEKLIVRFDADDLAQPLHVYSLDGRYLGAAACIEAVGFNDVASAEKAARNWKQFMRHTRSAGELQDRMSIDELARRLPAIERAEAPPEPRVVRPLFAGSTALKPAAAPEPEADGQERVLAALRSGREARRGLRLIEAPDEDAE